MNGVRSIKVDMTHVSHRAAVDEGPKGNKNTNLRGMDAEFQDKVSRRLTPHPILDYAGSERAHVF